MGQPIEPLGCRVLPGIGAIDPIDVGGLQYRLRADFGCPQHGRSICGEERIAGSAPQQHDPTFREILMRCTSSEQLADLGHDESREAPRGRSPLFDRRLQRKAVHDGGEHAHGIARRA